MRILSGFSPSILWALLIALTLLAFAIGESQMLGFYSTLLIVSIAAFKSNVVIQEYMEAHRAARHWRILYGAWNFTAAAMIIVGHYMAVT